MQKMRTNSSNFIYGGNHRGYCMGSFCTSEPKRDWLKPAEIGKRATGS